METGTCVGSALRREDASVTMNAIAFGLDMAALVAYVWLGFVLRIDIEQWGLPVIGALFLANGIQKRCWHE